MKIKDLMKDRETCEFCFYYSLIMITSLIIVINNAKNKKIYEMPYALTSYFPDTNGRIQITYNF